MAFLDIAGASVVRTVAQLPDSALTTNQINYATITYTANGFAQTVLDGANNLTTVVYDNYDRPYQVQLPMPTAGSGESNPSDYEQYGYDNNSNLTTKRLRSGDTVTFAYDALNRPTSETFPAGKSRNVYWGYDLLNRQLYANYGSPSAPGVSWTYDALGRIVTATNSGRTLAYQYDAAGNRTRMTWPDTGANALYVQYVYDVLNRVTQIEENGATSGPGLLASYLYDSLGRRSSVARAGGSGAATEYTYDGASRLYTLAQTLAGSASVTYTLGYNAANQIVTKAVSNSAYVANPASITAGYTANGLNQYTAVTGITASYVAANAGTLTYDATGALQTETTARATTTFLYDGTNLVGEYSSTGTILNRYVPGPGVDEPVLWYQGSGTTTRSGLTADNQGSVIGYADQSGNSGATYAYGPYGEPITSTGASAWGGSRYRFTGQIEIPEAQLYDYKARVYDPAMGRFYQTDPVGYGSDVNLYAYATEDPINGSDSSGMYDDPEQQPPLDGPPGSPEIVIPGNGLPSAPIPVQIIPGGPLMNAIIGDPDFTPFTDSGDDIPPSWLYAPGIGSGGLGNVMLVSNSTSQPRSGHDYRTNNKVCGRALSPSEERNLVSRFAVPSVFSGNPVGNGEYLVTNSFGVPGGIVQTTFSADGLSGTNVTTPVHAFVGTIVRSVVISGGATFIATHGFGNAGNNDLGRFRYQNNQQYGPGIFNQRDSRAAAYAASHYPGC